jgi:hypothetical protein
MGLMRRPCSRWPAMAAPVSGGGPPVPAGLPHVFLERLLRHLSDLRDEHTLLDVRVVLLERPVLPGTVDEPFAPGLTVRSTRGIDSQTVVQLIEVEEVGVDPGLSTVANRFGFKPMLLLFEALSERLCSCCVHEGSLVGGTVLFAEMSPLPLSVGAEPGLSVTEVGTTRLGDRRIGLL